MKPFLVPAPAAALALLMVLGCGGGGGGEGDADGGDVSDGRVEETESDPHLPDGPDAAEEDGAGDTGPEADLPDVCEGDCTGKACGDDGCGGTCGECGAGYQCRDFQCVEDGPDCSVYPYSAEDLYAEREGFGRETTGGDPGRVYHVTNLDDAGDGSLRQGLESGEPFWIVFDVEGTIRLESRVDIGSDQTIDGRGRAITVVGSLRIPAGTSNVIVTDIAVTTEGGDQDAFTLYGTGGDSPDDFETRHFWFHHLELYDSGDGLIDVRGATDITISWCLFHTHLKALLHYVDMDGNPTAGMRETMHHNYFYRVTRRGPNFQYGLCDYYNNYQFEWYEYGAGSFYAAQFLSESNIYEARPGAICIIPCPDPNPGGDSDPIVSKLALINDWDSRDPGYIRSVGDLTLNEAAITVFHPELVFERATFYDASPEPADDTLKLKIVNGAGPRVSYCRD